MLRLLEQLGVSIEHTDNAVRFHAQTLMSTEASYDLVRQMRASILVLGPLLARCGHAKVSLPGGCAIGTRPVDIHLEGLRRLGAEISVHEGNIEANAPHGLRGATLNLPLVSVTATENLMMAAALAEGETHILHAAREPEIVDLAKCLRSMTACSPAIWNTYIGLLAADTAIMLREADKCPEIHLSAVITGTRYPADTDKVYCALYDDLIKKADSKETLSEKDSLTGAFAAGVQKRLLSL